MNVFFQRALRMLLFGVLLMKVTWERLRGQGVHAAPRKIVSPEEKGRLAAGDGRLKRLFDHHVHQVIEPGCSIATMATLLNAMGVEPGIDDQLALPGAVAAGNWAARMSDAGYHGRRGLPLPVLEEVVTATLKHVGIRARVEAIAFHAGEPEEERAARLHEALDRFSADPSCYLVAHFNQGELVPVIALPHISPVGKWIPEEERVVVLDVDPGQPEPYSVSFDRFLLAISSDYDGIMRRFGYDHGGLVSIRLG